MERLIARIRTARRAIATLRELSEKPTLSVVERDAALQRFEYSFEATWKAVQLYLRTVEGIDVGSPKAVVRASLDSGLLDATETRSALVMGDDRNLTAHTYEEQLAQQIASRLPEHAKLLNVWIERVAQRTAGRA